MSNIAIQGAATGTGVFTLASPATNTDRTLVLPDEAGTVLTSAGVPASALPAGSVIQVVQASTTTTTVTSSTSFVATAVTVTITPTSATSKILILHNGVLNTLGSTVWCFYTLYRNAVNLYASGSQGAIGGLYSNGTTDLHAPSSIAYLDSPATTAAVTYTVYIKSNNSGVNIRYNGDGWYTTINALEIAA